MASIVELIDAFHGGNLSSEDYLSGLDRHIQFAQRRLSELDKQKIVPEDQALWQATLLPGLQAAYEGMIGAATEAKEYARSRKDDVLQGVGLLLTGVNQVMAILLESSGQVSADTRQILLQTHDVPNDGLDLQNRSVSGSAESKVSFLD